MDKLEISRGPVAKAVKVGLYGPEGIGKSTLAAQFPDPLFIDTEGSTLHMNVARTEKPTSWPMLLEQVRYVRDHPNVCSTLVIDTADWAEQLCIAQICATKKLTGIEDLGYGKGYVYLAEEFGRLLNLLEELISRGVNVVLNAHAMMRKFEQPDEMGAYDRWELKMQKKTTPLVKEWTDLLLFANYKTMSVATDNKGKKFKAQGGQRVLYTSHHPCWDAKNRFGMPDELPMEYTALSPYLKLKPTTSNSHTDTSSASPSPAPVQPPAAVTESSTANADKPAETPAQEPADSLESHVEDTLSKHQDNAEMLHTLHDLMEANGVTDFEVQAAVAARGYFPEETPLEVLPPDFISGVLIGAWPQVLNWIKTNQPLPF